MSSSSRSNSTRANVDLPAPEPPSNTTTSPAPIVRSTPSISTRPSGGARRSCANDEGLLMPQAKLALSFRIFQGGQLIREERLVQGVFKIGKVPSAHLRLDDESVSRMHAIIEVTGGEVSLIDLGSTRGTHVNGKRINKARLVTGDVLEIGAMRVELAISEAALAIAAPAPAIAVPVPAASRPPITAGTVP